MTTTELPSTDADPSQAAPRPRRVAPGPATPATRSEQRYLPGLDGLRAISVAAVLAFHADLTWIPGGFLGVEVFFVISGYLITALLMEEIERRGRLNLKRFWIRRARRLLPALALFLVVTTTVMLVAFRDEVPKMRGQLTSSLVYVTNWYEIFSDTDYFGGLGRAPALRHLWSLAVEEQFYLLWPVILAVVLAICGGRRLATAGVVTVLAAGSAALMWFLYDPEGSVTRVYYGTDTRACGLLLGAALGLAWKPAYLSKLSIGKFLGELFGLAAIAGLVVLFCTLDGFDQFLYRGGFVLVDVLTLIAIIPLTRRGGLLGEVLLGNPVMRWLGTRSYGIYLWHWPIFTLSRDYNGVPMSAAHLAVCVLITVVVSELSYRLVEAPIRSGVIGRWWKRRGVEGRDLGPRGVAIAGVSLAAVVGLGAAVATASASTNEIEAELEAIQEANATTSVAPASTTTTTIPIGASVSVIVPEASTTPTSVDQIVSPGDAPTTTASVTALPTITAIGDSVMLGASPTLQEVYGQRITVDAEVGRQFSEAVDVVRRFRAENRLGEVVLIHLGDNGPFSDAAFDTLMAELADRKVIFVNVKVPRRWEGEVNDALIRNILRYPGVQLLDWKATIEGSGTELRDGMHVDSYGADWYAYMVSTLLPVAL